MNEERESWKNNFFLLRHSDITKMPANVKPVPNPRHSSAVETSGPRQQQRKVQQKKKKKGSKW